MKAVAIRLRILTATIGLTLLILSAGTVAIASTGSAIPPELKSAVIADRYKIEGSAGSGYHSWNATNRIGAGFRGNATEIEVHGKHFTLSVVREGQAGRMTDPGVVTHTTVSGTRLDRVYASGLREWFCNEAHGLEQGFVIAARRGTGGLSIRLAVSADWQVKTSQDLLVFTSAEAKLEYGGLKAWDARGIALPSRMRAQGRQVAIDVDDSDAVYPIVIDPIFTQQQELTASDGVSGDAFGMSVSLSGDGSTALIGASYKTVGGNAHQGAAYVYTRVGTVWTQQQDLTAADGAANDYFGRVSLSRDGLTAVIGAPLKNVGSNNQQGAAYVFVRNANTWIQQQELSAADGASGDGFGAPLALSNDGSTVLVGAPAKTIGTNNQQGAAYVYLRIGASWAQQQELTALDATQGDYFGSAAALSSDGSMALLGVYNKTINGNAQQGAAYVFARSGATWSQQQRLISSDGSTADHFGSSAALSSDASTAIVGAYNKTVGATPEQGAAYVFTRVGTSWSQQQELTVSDGGAGDYLGYTSLGLSSDGSTALVGTLQNTVNGLHRPGAAYLFVRNNTAWGQLQKLTAPDGAANDQFGFSVALTQDGATSLVGALNHTYGQGAAYAFFAPTSPVWTVTNTNDSGPGSLRDAISSAGAGDTVNFSLTYPAIINLTSGTLLISKNVTINGPGSSNLIISGSGGLTVISVADAANVNIFGVTISSGGFVYGTGSGGGGIVNSGNLVLTDSSVSGNSAGGMFGGYGAGIANQGVLTVINCEVSGNLTYGNGGGIYNGGTATITNTSLTNNTANGGPFIGLGNGGAVYNTGSLIVFRSTLSGNTSSGDSGGGNGAGIFNFGGTLTLVYDTLSDNSAGGNGPGGAIYNTAEMTMINSTLSGGGIYNIGFGELSNDTILGGGVVNGGNLTIKGTILANGSANCSLIAGSYTTSAGYNLSDDTSCSSFLNNPSDMNGAPAGLDPNGLQDNGGPTQTIALLPSSPAVDVVPVGPNGYCTAADGVTPSADRSTKCVAAARCQVATLAHSS